MTNNKNIENSLKQVLNGINNMVIEDQISLFEEINHSENKLFDNIKYPKDLFYKILYPFENYISGLIRTKIYNNDDIVFIYKNYDFIKNHITKIFEIFEGTPCSADKSSVIIKGLVDFYKDNKKIEFNYNGEYTFHLPKLILKEHIDIINFYISLNDLYYGNSQKYLIEILNIKNKINSNK